MTEITIEGAGIAGQVLHRELSLQGIPSRIVERASFPRPKVCGGVLQWNSWQYLKDNFGLDEEPTLIESVSHFWRGKKMGSVRLPKPMVYVSRLTLDEALWKQQTWPRKMSEDVLCVNAKGVLYAPEGDWLGFEGESLPVKDLEMHYGRGICAGISPTAEKYAHLAFIVKHHRFRDTVSLERYLREELGIRAISALRGTGRIHYGYFDHLLAVGDAKMTTFPFLGLGMKHAILSSRLLAAKISGGEILSYSAAHRRQFKKYRLLSAVIGSIYDSPFQFILKPLIRSQSLFLAVYRWVHEEEGW